MSTSRPRSEGEGTAGSLVTGRAARSQLAIRVRPGAELLAAPKRCCLGSAAPVVMGTQIDAQQGKLTGRDARVVSTADRQGQLSGCERGHGPIPATDHPFLQLDRRSSTPERRRRPRARPASRRPGRRRPILRAPGRRDSGSRARVQRRRQRIDPTRDRHHAVVAGRRRGSRDREDRRQEGPGTAPPGQGADVPVDVGAGRRRDPGDEGGDAGTIGIASRNVSRVSGSIRSRPSTRRAWRRR